MELIYIWIKNYKNIDECAVALNPKFIYTKCYRQTNKTLKINLIESNNFVRVFDKNLNILAIVGQNGSGKSNLTSAIASIIRANSSFARDKEDSNYFDNTLPKEYCLIWRKNNKFYYTGSANYEITTQLGDIVNKHNFKSKCAIFKPFLLEQDEDVLSFPKDIHQEGIIEKKLNNYFYYDRFRIYETTKSLRKFFDVGKNLKVLTDSENGNLSFDSYGYEIDIKQEFSWLNRQLKRARSNYFITNKKRKSHYYFLKFVDSLIYRNSIIARNVKTMKNFDLAITAGCFSFGIIQLINLLEINHGCKDIIGDKIKLEQLIECLKLRPYSCNHIIFENFWKSAREAIKYFIKDENSNNYKDLIETFKIYESLESKLNKNSTFFSDLIISHGNGLFRLKNTVNISDKLSEEINWLNKLKIFRLNFYKISNGNLYSFFELSTGEQRMLRFFADLASVIDKSDVFILDEMDLSWHPEWQRKMVYYVHDLFMKLNKKHQVNIFFTTHSPFILSDIPKENVIIMNKGNAKYANFETFASNIHDLFNKNLFLNCEDCYTIGEFAKEKINKIVKILNRKNISDNKLQELEKKINIIGEPIIRTTLLNKLYSNPYYINNDESIEHLRTKIFELKRMLDAKN